MPTSQINTPVPSNCVTTLEKKGRFSHACARLEFPMTTTIFNETKSQIPLGLAVRWSDTIRAAQVPFPEARVFC